MALKKHQAVKPAASRRRPGESAVEWTVRTAYLHQKPTGRWVIKHTVATDTPGGGTSYRTAEQACFTRDEPEAGDRFAAWKQACLTASQPKATRFTFRLVANDYAAATRPRRLTRAQEHTINKLNRAIGDHPADGITEQLLAELHQDLLDAGWKEGTARRHLSVVLTVLKWAARNKIISMDAVPFYRMPSVSPPRDYTLTAEEDARVFDLAAEWLERTGDDVARRAGLFACIALDSGQRRDAILELTWDRISLTPGHEYMNFVNPAYRPKNKKRCGDVFVTDRLLAILKREALRAPKAHGKPTGPLFPSHRLMRGFDRFKAEAGLPRLTPHVFRHTFATLRIQRGWTVADVAHILADNPATVARVYLHNAGVSVRENARRIDAMRQAWNNNTKVNDNVVAASAD